MASKRNNKTSLIEATQISKNSFNTFWWRILISIFVLIIYGNTTSYQYTLDDDIFYQKHASVQKGLDGIPELFTQGSMAQFDGSKGVQPYRPITLLSFALEKHFFDNNPAKSHLINLLLYLFIIQLLFALLLKLLSQSYAFFVTMVVLLFALHPIHTEVVASVKSRDELMAMCFGLMSWYAFIVATQQEKKSFLYVGLSALYLFASLLSKESAIAFLVLIPLAIIMLTETHWKKTGTYMIPFAFVTGLFFILRYKAIGTETFVKGVPVLDNVLHAAKGVSQITATKMEILFYNIKLLFWPWPLSWDYSFNQIPLMDVYDILPWVSFCIYGFLLIMAVVFFKKKPILSFGIFFFMIASTPTNNLFFINGATVAERFLFTPSIGFIIAFAYAVTIVLKIDLLQIARKQKRNFIICIGLLSLVYFMCSFYRVPDWENNFKLFAAGVVSSPNSSRTNQAFGTEYENKAKDEPDPMEHKRLNDSAIYYLQKSVDILPTNSDATYKLAQVYEMNGDVPRAIEYYKKSIQSTPGSFVALNNLGVIYAGQKNFDAALELFNKAYQIDSTIELTIANLMVVHANKGQLEKVVQYGNRAKALGIVNNKINDLYNQAQLKLRAQ